ncbi:amino acid ABC transporter membrane protein (PAAT family) [Pasteurella langaaensis DSM 22999]|uniref:Amino acid ABC transporter membrane protein (PAAT family) n=1 Tax=Alitibacter langaaensis DSM 22999 TaxID=1122935 RepID=A0A2U0T5F5_9PAST|nr:amino acid ABC transporter permease [Pasteurella langaaensis]PVX38797.1 amino acid ABC transporter membrane protein (PAAT family) [Pasteurella langaaensis DSM 22999]
MNFDFSYFLSVFPEIIGYLPTTLLISVVSILVAIIFGLCIALIRIQRYAIIDQILAVYISLFRSMPSVVLLFLVYYGSPQIVPAMVGVPALTAAIICFALKYSAYLAEIFRAALESVDAGQKEAGIAVGLSQIQIYRHVVLPQAFVNALPGTGNMFISLLKDSSVAFFVGVPELLSAAKLMTVESYKFFETYLAVGIVYWLVVILYSWGQKILETKLSAAYKR